MSVSCSACFYLRETSAHNQLAIAALSFCTASSLLTPPPKRDYSLHYTTRRVLHQQRRASAPHQVSHHPRAQRAKKVNYSFTTWHNSMHYPSVARCYQIRDSRTICEEHTTDRNITVRKPKIQLNRTASSVVLCAVLCLCVLFVSYGLCNEFSLSVRACVCVGYLRIYFSAIAPRRKVRALEYYALVCCLFTHTHTHANMPEKHTPVSTHT